MNDVPATSKPGEFSDMAIWAAWLYYVDELTQMEVAKRLNISRVTVIKLLSEAKDRGIVKIEIDPAVASKVDLSRELKNKYKLEEALVIPELTNGDLLQRLGKAAALMLLDILEHGETLAVAWGRTVSAAAQAVSDHSQLRDITVTQLVASPDGLASDFSPELCSSLLANRLSARCVNILAPAVVSSPEIKASLMAEPSLKSQFDVIRSASTAIFGIGELGDGATVESHNLHNATTLQFVKERGAVAVIMGLFLNINGDEVQSDVHDRMISASIADLEKISKRIGVAGGRRKVDSILAALRAGLITHLVIDESTAKLVLNHN